MITTTGSSIAGTSVEANFTYQSAMLQPLSGGWSLNLSGGVETKFTGPASLSVLSKPEATLDGLSLAAGPGIENYGMSPYNVLGTPIMPPVGIWFNLALWGGVSGTSGSGNDAYSYSANELIWTSLDPTMGVVAYDTTSGTSMIKFTSYPTSAVQQSMATWGVGVELDGNHPGITEDGISAPYQTANYQGTPTTSVTSLSITRGPAICGDERDTLIAQYVGYLIPFVPTCSDFTQTAHGASYSFANLNISNYDPNSVTHQQYSWALVRYPLVVPASLMYGLDYLIVLAGQRNLNSAYRNPAENASVGGSSSSQHMYGDAVDLQNLTDTRAEWASVRMQALTQAGATYVEPWAMVVNQGGHIHVEWSSPGVPGLYAPSPPPQDSP